MTVDIELAWAAGFFDGEGSVSLRNIRSRTEGFVTPKLRVSVYQSDRRPLDRFAAAVGAGRVYGPYVRQGRTERPYFQWFMDGTRGIGVLGVLWPFLSEPKREQIASVAADLAERSVSWRKAAA